MTIVKMLEKVEDLLKMTDDELNEVLCDEKYNKANLREQIRRSLTKTKEYKQAFEYERKINTQLMDESNQ